MPPAPNFELARQAGATVTYQPQLAAFAVEADDSGRTKIPSVFVAGVVSGACSAAASRESGLRAGRAIEEALG
jgi:hypothetical protein